MVRFLKTCHISTGGRIVHGAAAPLPPARAPAPASSGSSTGLRLSGSRSRSADNLTASSSASRFSTASSSASRFSTASSSASRFSMASSDIQPTASELSQNRREIEEEDEAEEVDFNTTWERLNQGVPLPTYDNDLYIPPPDPARQAVA